MLVEFFGIPRQRSGLVRLELHAPTVQAVQAELVARFPDLADPARPDHLHPAFTLNLNGNRFLTAEDDDLPLTAADLVLVLSADAGG